MSSVSLRCYDQGFSLKAVREVPEKCISASKLRSRCPNDNANY